MLFANKLIYLFGLIVFSQNTFASDWILSIKGEHYGTFKKYIQKVVDKDFCEKNSEKKFCEIKKPLGCKAYYQENLTDHLLLVTLACDEGGSVTAECRNQGRISFFFKDVKVEVECLERDLERQKDEEKKNAQEKEGTLTMPSLTFSLVKGQPPEKEKPKDEKHKYDLKTLKEKDSILPKREDGCCEFN